MKSIKKLFAIVLCICLFFSISACDKKDERITEAIEILSQHWKELYQEDGDVDDWYVEIVNTTIINIKDGVDEQRFENVDYIVEFELRTNYFNTAPYYSNSFLNNCVIVAKDGSTSVGRNLFDIYRATTYSTDYSHIIESIEEFHGEYDRVLKLKKGE